MLMGQEPRLTLQLGRRKRDIMDQPHLLQDRTLPRRSCSQQQQLHTRSHSHPVSALQQQEGEDTAKEGKAGTYLDVLSHLPFVLFDHLF